MFPAGHFAVNHFAVGYFPAGASGGSPPPTFIASKVTIVVVGPNLMGVTIE